MRITILYLEDDPKDVELVERLLEDSGYECDVTVIETEEALRNNLQRTEFDLILSDCALPAYDGFAALSTAKQLQPEVPFIFVSGTLGEEVAIECVKGGATDYVLKDRLSRLPPVVARALKEANNRKDHEEVKKKLEETQQAFYQSQKMETIGRLTGGIAHDFNNMLAIVLGYAEVVQRRTDESDPRYQYVGEIVTASRRAAGLVEQLLSYSRNQRLSPESLQLNDELEAIAKMLQRLVGERITIEISRAEGLWPVDLDRVRFDQVMFNLVANARDAIRDSGSVMITTENRRFESSELPAGSRLSGGEYVLVHVRDTGSGMDATVLESIFEPFFTTKEPGKGTGLGLASSLGIIRQSGGSISVTSEPGVGTQFDILLPRGESKSSAILGRTSARRGNRSNPNATLLVVDDDHSVLNLLKLVTSNAGYTVIAADSGRAALERARDYGGKIDLLVTDVMLPDCSGVELSSNVRLDRPDVKVAYTSGYGNSVIEQLGLVAASTTILAKPFTVDELLDHLRRLLQDGSVHRRHRPT